jgi:UDP-2-acetamido-2,6-beta-L-arabino-hexul-4-ose reductase
MSVSGRSILVTGANGFIGRNLVVRLNEMTDVTVLPFVRGDQVSQLRILVARADAVVHLAGENRPRDDAEFLRINEGLTTSLCDAIEYEYLSTGRQVPLIFASSAQAAFDNPYGRSKLAAEKTVYNLARKTANPCIVYRLPGVFGKWCRPNYNSVVATFCHNIARDLPVQVSDSSAILRLVYVDDVIDAMLQSLKSNAPGCIQASVEPEYTIRLGELEAQIRAFADCRISLMSEPVGTGLVRALYATYVSNLPTDRFSYTVRRHSDPRGVFVEMLKTKNSGQFSYFTAHPGITRGGHYHHTKSEKFLVVKGQALFRFRHLLTDEIAEIRTSGAVPQVVDTIPGWAHDITNVGDDEMVVLLWANENFDRRKPDTVVSKVVN